MTSSVINATINGINATGGNVAELELQVGGTTALTIDSNGFVFNAPLPVVSGGTGSNTLTANNVILGNGTSAVQFVAPGTNGNVLTSNGTTWTSAAASSGTPTVNEYNTPVTGATWTKPASANFVLIEIWGGGGSGGRGQATDAAGGGGGGAYNSALVKFSDLVGAVTYTVASGGASRTSTGVGNAGGTSQVDMASFQGGSTKQLFSYGGGGGGGGTLEGGGGGGGGQLEAGQVGAIFNQANRSGLTAWGGRGGGPGGGNMGWDQIATCSQYIQFLAQPGSSGGGGGGSGRATSVSFVNLTSSYWAGAGSIYGGGGGGGGCTNVSSSATNNIGGDSLYGGGGGGGSNATTTGGNGGTSVWGGAGSAGTTGSTASAAGTQPGGGSGGTEGGNSGQGGDGRVRFTYW